MSERETANQLASSIWWSEKLQLLCPSYFYVNARRARYDYLLRQGTWSMMFGVGKTATSILNEAAARPAQCSGSAGLSSPRAPPSANHEGRKARQIIPSGCSRAGRVQNDSGLAQGPMGPSAVD
jgi:hypothetical protein